jgi:serine protease Do
MFTRLTNNTMGALLLGAMLLFGSLTFTTTAFAADREASISLLNQLSDAFAQIAEEASPAVVFIQVEKQVSVRGIDPRMGPQGWPFDFFDRFFGPGGIPGMPTPQSPGPDRPGPQDRIVPYGQGTGFILSADGYIVTNHHVVGEADRVKVTLADGREFDAEIAGTDPQTEVALIKIDTTDLPYLPLGNSDSLRVGEWVLAIGSPFGLNHSVTAGIVSARGRGNLQIVDYADFIQTDAAINPGNSGGPLLNLAGEVVGMNTAILSRSGGNVGIGFAIPINMVKYIEGQLKQDGTVRRGFLGVGIQNLTSDIAQWFDLPNGRGALVTEVTPDSPADRAGLKPDDVIVEFDGKPVEDVGSFRSRVATTAPGSKVDIDVLRKGNRLTKRVEIGTLDEDMQMARRGDEVKTPSEIGITVQNLSDEIAERLGYEGQNGVVVSGVERGSAVEAAGIQPGVLIQEVNRKPVKNVQDFTKALKDSAGQRSTLLRLRDGEMSRYVAIELKKGN